MSRIATFALTVGLVATFAPTADAKPKKTAAKTEPASDQDADAAACKQNDDTTTCWFEDDVVGGEALTPTGHNVSSRTRLRFESLIRIRGHFLPELVQLARDV